MITPDSWKTAKLDVLKDITLDYKNVRLENTNDRVEADIIADLFMNEKVLDLVEGICTVGYLGHERPIVVEREGRYVVVEGNRRLAALKSIQNPHLVPSFTARIQKNIKKYPNTASLRKIEVLIAPTQEDANELIAALHTGTPREKWTPARQAAFFQIQIDEGKTLQELIDRYPLLKVKDFVFQAKFYNKIKNTEFDDPELSDFFHTPKGRKSVSTIKRIYLNKQFKEMLALEMNDSGEISARISEKTFKEIATFIVRGMREEGLNTRTLNSNKDFEKFNQKIQEIINKGEPGEIKILDTKISSEENEVSKQSQPETHASQKYEIPSNQSQKLAKSNPNEKLEFPRIPDNFPLALRYLYKEFQSLPIDKSPHISYLCIRSVLEKSIKSFAGYHGRKINQEMQTKNAQLSHCLQWLLEKYDRESIREIAPSIKTLRGDSKSAHQFIYSLEAMNASAHNHNFIITQDDVIKLWNQANPIINFLFTLHKKDK